MCGRFPQNKRPSRYETDLDPDWGQTYLEFSPSWNVSPGREVLVFHDNEAGHVAELLHWGFLPYWADAKARRPINARLETAATIPYFRRAWRVGRCVIPADGWYEWKETPAGKVPYFIHRQDEGSIFLAGLYEINRHENTSTFAILTTEAEGALREIHEREPVAFTAEIARQWIRRDLSLREVSELALVLAVRLVCLAHHFFAREQSQERWAGIWLGSVLHDRHVLERGLLLGHSGLWRFDGKAVGTAC